MDEYNSGIDPEIKRLFKNIINSFSFAALWLLCIATLGIFFQLGFVRDGIRWYNIIFYLIFIFSLWALIRYYLKQWNR